MSEIVARRWLVGTLGAFLLLVALNMGLTARAADGESASVSNAVSTGYKFDRQTAAFRTGVAVVDTAATTMSDANLTACGVFDAEGRINIPVSARFSVASRTCKIRLVSAWYTTSGTWLVTGMSDEVTLTGSGIQRSSKYVAPNYVFDSYGGRVVFILVTEAPASGTVDLWVGSY